ncbi:unnamed protein product, partial [Tenebrio molitor]
RPSLEGGESRSLASRWDWRLDGTDAEDQRMEGVKKELKAPRANSTGWWWQEERRESL